MFSVTGIILTCLLLTAIAAYFDIKQRSVPYWLIAVGFVILVVRGLVVLNVSYALYASLGWFCVFAILAYLVHRQHKPLVAEGDFLWLGVVSGIVSYPDLVLVLIAGAALAAVGLWIAGMWRKGQPAVVAIFLSLVFLLVLVVR